MFIFTPKGREAYLAFVRNIPSQILLLSPCFILPKLKNFSWLDGTYIVFWGLCLVMALWAIIANLLEFINAANSQSLMREKNAELRKSGLSGWRLFVKKVRALGGEILSLAIMITFFYGGLITVLVMMFSVYFPKS